MCFECLQTGDSRPKIVTLANHKGFLCESCATNSKSFRVWFALYCYRLELKNVQPSIGDITQEILLITATGFKGTSLEYWKVIRERDGYNHSVLESVRIALDVLTQENVLKASYDGQQFHYYEDRPKIQL